MWMNILGKFLLSGCLAATCAVADAPEYYNLFPVPAPIEEYAPIVIDQKELLCLQKNIFFEARGEGRPGMRAVAAVTINRTTDGRWPDTVCGVVYQRSQFSWTSRGDRKPILNRDGDIVAWKIAGEVAENALTGKLQHNVKGAQYFHATRVNPGWSRRFQYVATIGNHKFYQQH